jgi:replicative DNA helicase
MELDEIQTMLLAFVAQIDEDHIKKNRYEFDEEQRVREAAAIIQAQPLYVEIIPDFSLKDIENLIKRSIRMFGTKYIFYDYLHSSMKILEEISRRSGGIKLREDNILFLLSVKLKDICTQFDVFIMTSTQLNES